jgi:hypothetical protein
MTDDHTVDQLWIEAIDKHLRSLSPDEFNALVARTRDTADAGDPKDRCATMVSQYLRGTH